MDEFTNEAAKLGVVKKIMKIFIGPRYLFSNVKNEKFIQTVKYLIFLLIVLIVENFIFQFLLGSLIMRTIGPTFTVASSFLGSFLSIIYIPLTVIPLFLIATIILFVILKILRVKISFPNCLKVLIYSFTPVLLSIFLFFAFSLLFFLLVISLIHSICLLIIGLGIFVDGSRIKIRIAAIASNLIFLVTFPIILFLLLFSIPESLMQKSGKSNLTKLNEKQLDFICECGLGFNYPENWEIDKNYIRGTNLSRGDTVLKLKEDEHNNLKNKIFISMFNKIFNIADSSAFGQPLADILEVNTRNENEILQNGVDVKKEIADNFQIPNNRGEVYKEKTLLKFKSGRKALLIISCEIQRKDECLKEIDYIINSFTESE